MGWSWRSFINWGWGALEAGAVTRDREPKAGVVTFPQDEDKAVTAMGLERTRLECRNLVRNDTVISGVVKRFADNVVGSGIMPQAKTSDPQWNAEAEAYFREWAKIADYRQRCSLWDLQRLIINARLLDGECGFVLVNNGQLQPIEAERIRQPQPDVAGVIDGIAVNGNGIKTAYYVHRRDKTSGMFTGQDFEIVPAANFKHISAPFRFDQVRSWPELAPIVNAVKDLGEYVEATLLKAKNEAKRFYVIKNEAGAPTGPTRRYEETTVGATIERVQTGEIHYLRPKESMDEIGSNTPGQQFDPFTEKILRLIGASLGLPYEFVLLDFSEGSFSSSRAALMQTYRTFMNWQQWLIGQFLQPVWNWRIAKAIKEGQLRPAPVNAQGVSDWYHVQWQTPEYEWIDPQNEAQARTLEISAGVNSLTQWARKKGHDAEEILTEKGKDIAYAQRIAEEINAEHNTKLTWKDLITLGMPGQVTKQEDVVPQQPKGKADETE